MKIQKILSLVLALVMVLSLAACGAKPAETTAATEGAPAATEGAAATEAPTAPQEITVAAIETAYGSEIWQKVAEAFTAETGINVKLTTDKNLEDVISASMQGGEYPDVIHLATGRPAQLTEQFIKDKAIAEITDVLDMTVPGESKKVSEKISGGFTETSLTNPYGDGKTYLAPMFYSPCGLFYNAKLFEAKGWTVPTTWDEMWELGEKAKAEGIALFTYPTAGYYDAFMYALIYAIGGADYFDAVTHYEEGIWDTPESDKLFEILDKLASYGYCVKTVAVLNCWGRMRSWGCHMVHHALYQKQNYSYAGVIEVLSGAPFDVRFLSFNEVKENPHILDDIDVIVNVGDGDTSHTGGQVWEDPVISSAIRGFVHRGGGFIGVGEPSGHQYQGRYLQLAGVLGVEKETGLTLSYDKYNWEEHPGHFILADTTGPVDFGEGKKSIYALDGTEILVQREKEVQMAANAYGSGRAVYISGLPYSFENSRILYRSILWSSHAEGELHKWFSENFNVEVHAFEKNGKYCVVNNTYEPQDTVVYRGDGSSFPLHLDANEICWYEIG